MKTRTSIIILAAILLLGGTIRIIGIRHGFPDYLYHPDVSKIGAAEAAIYHNDLGDITGHGGDFRFKAYPYGAAVFTGHFLRILDNLSGREHPALLVSDTASARWKWAYPLRCFAVITVLAAFGVLLLTLRLQMSPAGWILCGLLLVLEPYNAQYSHYGMNDVPMVAFLLMAWACTWRLTHGKWLSTLRWAGAGGCIGIAFGIKYQAIIGCVMVLPAAWKLLTDKKWKPLCTGLLVFIAGAGAGAWITCPLLHNPRAFWEGFIPFMHWQSTVVHLDASRLVRIGYNLLGMLRMMTRSGQIVLIILGATGWFLYGRKNVHKDTKLFIQGGLVFVGTMLLILIGFRALPRSNDLLTIFPFIIILLGVSIPLPQSTKPEIKFRLWIPITLLVVIFFGIISMLDSLALTRPDTRIRALNWCLENVRPGEKIYREYYTLPLNMDDINEQLAGTAKRGVQKKRILQNQFDYLELSSLAHERFLDPCSPYYDGEIREYYCHLFENYPVLAEFKDRRLFFAHPRIRIIGPQTTANR